MKRFVEIALLTLALTVATSCQRPIPRASAPAVSPSLAAIDTMMWKQPDSAFRMLLDFAESPSADSLDTYNGHYLQLLIAELLYKNDYQQTNRAELLRAVGYFDTLVAQGGTPAQAFLDARAHYINGVGFYERDSVVKACQEYLHTLEIMETPPAPHIPQFMALTYTLLTVVFSDQYLHDQAIFFGKRSLEYYSLYDAEPWHIAWMLDEIGSHYYMLEQNDSAAYYYRQAQQHLSDTTGLLYRDIKARQVLLSYKMDGLGKDHLDVFRSLIQASESEKEYCARCLMIGGVYHNEKMVDSAWAYLTKVFENTESVDAKKQSAEWLVELCKIQGKPFEAYADYLVPFANREENASEIKSQLLNYYKEFVQKSWEATRHREAKIHMRRVGIVVGSLLLLLLVSILLMRTRKRRFEEQLSEERYAHEIKQKALGKRLKQKNQELQEARSQLEQHDDKNTLQKKPQESSFFEEPICKRILDICNNSISPIKSSIPVSAYADIALTYDQKAQLNQAVACHYGWLIDYLKKNYLSLKEKDFLYCHLCLLGLSNVQIGALLQKSPSTIWEQEKRLQRIFGKTKSIVIVLKEIMIENQVVTLKTEKTE